MNLFSIKYTPATNRRRKHIPTLCILLILNPSVDFSIKIVENPSILSPIQENIRLIFEQIKKNEIVDE
jgi:hypothetical protein